MIKRMCKNVFFKLDDPLYNRDNSNSYQKLTLGSADTSSCKLKAFFIFRINEYRHWKNFLNEIKESEMKNKQANLVYTSQNLNFFHQLTLNHDISVYRAFKLVDNH